ncbi:MAG: hypothetical protein AABP62_08495 [Planctomycetota bacterium]
MSPTTITTAERFVVDGPFGPPIAIGIGLVLALLFAFMLRRESSVLGSRNSVIFWCLRTAAVSIVLWMLLAPMKILVETSTTRRAIVFVTDVSGSMQTVDPAGSSDDLRWALTRSDGQSFSITREADQAVAALGIALRKLQAAREALQQHSQERQLLDSVAAAQQAVERAQDHVRRIGKAPSEHRSSDKIQTLVNRLTKLLSGAELQSFAQNVSAIKKNRTPAQSGWREGLPDLEHRISVIKTAAQELAWTAAENEGKQFASENRELLSSVRSASRLDRVSKSVDSLQKTTLSSLDDKADLRYSSFDQAVQWMSGPPAPENSSRGSNTADREEPVAAAGTDLSKVFASLQQEAIHQPLAAVFLLSDVAHNQLGGKHPRDVAGTLIDTPVYVVPIGNTQHVRDVHLRSVFAPTVAMRNDDIVIEASLQAFHCEGEVCVVQLLQDGMPIDQREILLDSGLATRTVRFERHVGTLGTEQFRVAVVPIEGELTADNNERDFEVNVTRNDIKILLADEFPRWEYRYLTQLFRRDTKVECDELLFHPRMIATGHREESKSVPITVDEWDYYDVIMLGDLATDHLPVAAQESLVKYLQDRGGTVVMIAGTDAMPHAYKDMPLDGIVPVEPVEQSAAGAEGGYEFRITAEGLDHPAMMIGETEEENRVAWSLVNHYSPLPAVSAWRKPKAAARPLIAAIRRNSTDPTADERNSAFLCWQQVGRGRIVYLSAPESFRLRFLRGDRLHYRFWGQLVRWAIAADLAAGSKFVRVRTDKSRYNTRETVQVTVRLANAKGEPVVADGVSASIIGADDSRTISLSADLVVPGEYRGEIRSLAPGEYRIEPAGNAVEQLQQENSQEPATATLSVQKEMSSELTETRCDRALAQQIADVTGGQVVPPTAIDEILKLTNLEPLTSETIQQLPLWVQWKYLWIVFGCLQSEWIVRRRLGLS